MRISDWSSDVCSSDLASIEFEQPAMEEISGIICAVDPAREPARHAEARFDRTNRVGHLDKQQVATLAKARKEDALPRPRLLQPGGAHHQRMRGTAVADRKSVV